MGRKGFLAALAGGVVASLSSAQAGVLITIDKSSQQMSVSVDGTQRYTWPVSTGRSGYATPSGTYTPFRMEEDHFSKEWDDAPMPHSIFFTPKGHAIHGSYETKHLGTAVSHGCVRLSPKNAETLYALVKEEGLSNAKVVLTGHAAPLIAQRSTPHREARDPIDSQRYQSSYAAQSGYGVQPGYGPSRQPQYQQPYAAQPRYQQQYVVQQRYPQPYFYDRQPVYGQPQYQGYSRYPY